MSRGGLPSDYRRIGDTAKCPACGVSMDPQAYRCPKCRIYFCFKCRRRVQPRDPQYQCMNQQCGQYGKLLCNACVVEAPVMGDRPKQILVEEGKPAYTKPSFSGRMLIFAFVSGGMLVSFIGIGLGLPWRGATVGSLVLAGILVGWLSGIKDRVYGVHAVYKTVTENVEVGRRKSCIACKQAVEHVG
jgi:hypothetical protein